MDKLSAELQRLFLVSEAGAPPALVDGEGRVRAMVLELTRAPDWEVLARVWQGVQAELALPAPGIAVSGVDALQLWFALAAPVPAAQAQAFLQGLRQRFLADVDARRLRLLPAEGGHAALVPAAQPDGNWSAFVAPDLAPVFGDTPWLDIPPSEEGQASLLRALAPIQPAAFAAALGALGGDAPASTPLPAPAAARPAAPAQPEQAQARQFLLRVMHDEGVDMALRIEAAKALLSSDR